VRRSRDKEKRDRLREIAKRIRILILDVDGVLTDGGIIFDNKGNEMKRFHVRDGHGVRMLMRAGIRVAIVTGRMSDVVSRRAKELGITDVYQGVFRKSIVYEEILKKYRLRDEEVAFMGDDVVDIEILKRVGLPAVPADADEHAKRYAGFISKREGGRGAVRELIDFILMSSGLWSSVSGEAVD